MLMDSWMRTHVSFSWTLLWNPAPCTHMHTHTHTHTTLVQFWECKIIISPSKSPGNIYTYRVKVINPERKSEFTMDKLSCTHRFRSITELKQGLSDHLKFSVETLGYIEPGHGLEVSSGWPVNVTLKRCTDLSTTTKRWLYGVSTQQPKW